MTYSEEQIKQIQSKLEFYIDHNKAVLVEIDGKLHGAAYNERTNTWVHVADGKMSERGDKFPPDEVVEEAEQSGYEVVFDNRDWDEEDFAKASNLIF